MNSGCLGLVAGTDCVVPDSPRDWRFGGLATDHFLRILDKKGRGDRAASNLGELLGKSGLSKFSLITTSPHRLHRPCNRARMRILHPKTSCTSSTTAKLNGAFLSSLSRLECTIITLIVHSDTPAGLEPATP